MQASSIQQHWHRIPTGERALPKQTTAGARAVPVERGIVYDELFVTSVSVASVVPVVLAAAVAVAVRNNSSGIIK